MLPASLSSNSSLKIDFMTLGDHGLTPRECEVMQWIAQGKRDGEIAIILSISRRTISHHVARILQKFGVETRTGAMSRAIDLLS